MSYRPKESDYVHYCGHLGIYLPVFPVLRGSCILHCITLNEQCHCLVLSRLEVILYAAVCISACTHVHTGKDGKVKG